MLQILKQVRDCPQGAPRQLPVLTRTILLTCRDAMCLTGVTCVTSLLPHQYLC